MLLRLGGHELLGGEASFKAAQQAIAPQVRACSLLLALCSLLAACCVLLAPCSLLLSTSQTCR